MNELLTWRGPLKAEVYFPFNARMNKFQNPSMDIATRLKRAGSDINPFWPMPSRARAQLVRILQFQNTELNHFRGRIFLLWWKLNFKEIQFNKSNLMNMEN